MAGYEELQEGLAVLAEYFAGEFTPSRLRTVAARVIAAACAAQFCAFAQAPASAADSGTLERALDRAFERYADLEEGEVADYIPALAAADPDRFGLVAMTVDGDLIARGDTEVPFAIMSAAKPFTLALLLQQQGVDVVLERIGVEDTAGWLDASRDADLIWLESPSNPLLKVADLEAIQLRQRVMRDVSEVTLSTELFGSVLRMPLILGPVGLGGMFAGRAEVQAATVKLCRERLQGGPARAVVVNSGNANACTGEQGRRNAARMRATTTRGLKGLVM